MRAARRRRSAALKYACLLLIPTIEVAGQTPVSYTGPSGGAWSNPANWSGGVVPANDGVNTYAVTIPDSRTVLFDLVDATSIDTLTLGGLSARLDCVSGATLTVHQPWTANGGIVNAIGGAFVTASPATANGYSPAYWVAAGGSIVHNGVIYRSDWQDYRANRTALSSEGANSLLDLSAVTVMNAAAYGHYSGNVYTYAIQALNNGVLDLSGMASLAGAGQDEWVMFRAVNNGQVRLNALSQISGRVGFEVQNASMSLPQVVDYANGRIILGNGGTLNAPTLASVTSTSFTTSGGTVLNAPSLVTVTDSSLALDGTWTLNTGAVSNLDYSRIAVSGGVIQSFPNVSSYRCDWQDYRGNRTALSVNGEGSVLDMSAVQSFNGAAYGNYSGNVYTYTVQASNGGVLDLSGMVDVVGAVQDDRLLFQATAGGVIQFNSLTQVTGRAGFDVQAASMSLPNLQTLNNSSINIGSGSSISLPKVQQMVGAGTAITLGTGVTVQIPMLLQYAAGPITLNNGATLQAPALTSIDGSTITATGGAVLDTPALVAITDSDLTFNGNWTLNTGTVTNLDYSRIAVSGGATRSFPSVTAYRCDWQDYRANRTVLSVDGAGSLLDLSAVQNFNGAAYGHYSGNVYTYSVQASNGGVLDLSALVNVAGAVQDDRLLFRLNAGGIMRLDSLAVISGRAAFDVQAAALSLPSLQTLNNSTLNVGTGSTANLPKLLQMTGDGTGLTLGAGVSVQVPMLVQYGDGPINLNNGSTLTAPALASINASTITATGGAVLDAPSLVSITNSDLTLNGNWTLNTGAVTSLDYSRILVSGGATRSFPNVTAYRCDWQDYRANRTALSADGAASLLDLSAVQNFNGAAYGHYTGNVYTYLVQASNGGVIDLSGVVTLTGATQDDRLLFRAASDGLIRLDALRHVNGRTTLEVAGGGRITARDLIVSDVAVINIADIASTMELHNLYLTNASSLTAAAAAEMTITESFLFAQTDEARIQLDKSIIRMAGSGLQLLEIGGTDSGPGAFTAGNFGIGQLVIGQDGEPTTVQLVDLLDNGNRQAGVREALYLYGIAGQDGLIINSGSTLILDNRLAYAWLDNNWVNLRDLFPSSITQVSFGGGTLVVPEPGTGLVLLAAAGLLAGRSRRRTR